MNVRSAYLVATLPVVLPMVLMACGAERLQGAAPKLDLSIEQAKVASGSSSGDGSDVVDFGDVVQPNSETRRITIANSGASQLHIMNVKQTGSTVFTISTPPSDVDSGKSAAFNATFKPTDIKPFTGAIDFDTDDPKQAHVTVKLIGSGSDPNLVVCTGPIDDLSGSNCTDEGRIIDYGNGIEKLSKVRAVRMIAATSSEVVIHSVNLVGDTQNAFVVDTIAANTTVPGNGDLVFNVKFIPPASGEYTAQVVIESNDVNHPQTTVTLKGLGNTDCSAFSETKTQTAAPLKSVDVLFVIDTSGSMGNTQKQITSQISNFIDQLTKSDLDYHLAVTTTDLSGEDDYPQGIRTLQGKDGTLLPGKTTGTTVVTTASSPSPVAAFQDILNNLDPNESGAEFGALAAVTALSPSGTPVSVAHRDDCNGGCVISPLNGALTSTFYRPEARIAIVIVSDEDDGGSPTDEKTSPSLYAAFFSGLKSDPDSMVRVVAIADPFAAGVTNCDSAGGDDGAPRYHALINALGAKQGLFINYCTDIAKSLQVSGGFIAQPDCTFDLDKGIMTPGPDNSITIAHGNADGSDLVLAAGDWHYVQPSPGHPYGEVSIDKQCPATQSQLEIDYTSCLRSYDADTDGVPDMQDNCECAANAPQDDANSDGIGDICQITGNLTTCIAQ